MTLQPGKKLPVARLLRNIRRSVAFILYVTLVLLGLTLYKLLF